jgi:DNA primase
MIAQQTIQQILSRIDIIEIVGGFVKLKKRGANYMGLCPFHNEKSPSFTVSPAKEIYKCFGCGRSGNTISFLMEHEKYSYAEALRWLAAKYNVEIEEKELSPELRQQQQVAESLYIIKCFCQGCACCPVQYRIPAEKRADRGPGRAAAGQLPRSHYFPHP